MHDVDSDLDAPHLVSEVRDDLGQAVFFCQLRRLRHNSHPLFGHRGEGDPDGLALAGRLLTPALQAIAQDRVGDANGLFPILLGQVFERVREIRFSPRHRKGIV